MMKCNVCWKHVLPYLSPEMLRATKRPDVIFIDPSEESGGRTYQWKKTATTQILTACVRILIWLCVLGDFSKFSMCHVPRLLFYFESLSVIQLSSVRLPLAPSSCLHPCLMHLCVHILSCLSLHPNRSIFFPTMWCFGSTPWNATAGPKSHHSTGGIGRVLMLVPLVPLQTVRWQDGKVMVIVLHISTCQPVYY